jgi:phosphatidylserine decarboxylase
VLDPCSFNIAWGPPPGVTNFLHFNFFLLSLFLMRIPLTKYGWPQVLIFPAALIVVMIFLLLVTVPAWPLWGILLVQVPPAALLIFALMFFRDPYRVCPTESNLLLAPADGKITNIEIVQDAGGIGQAAMKIGIFMSIFNTHINRAPCNVEIEKITYKKGMYKNAMNPESGRVNESNDLCFVRIDDPRDRLLVRQISGAIARRIVCVKEPGQKLAGGEKFGMIKFGSRTELYLPARENVKCLVRIGDNVKAGLTPLVRYELQETENA